MGRIFVGLVQCGAWGCFDEFNRLEQTVLSAVSQHIQAIQDAIHHRSPSVTLGQYTARVDPNSAIFITLNPAGKGYGGRQKMPDNLKQLFRPVVMSVPDNELIAETLLFAEGFREAKPLARKTLHEQLRQRIGVVVVGPSQSGKSTLWRVLKRALIISGQRLACYELNPKATTRTRLLGHMDMDTREWTDGIITMAARNVIKDTQVHTWIVCDGDIDPEWVEALNSVLDDNRLLTMPSGERIQFGANVNFLFETHHLQFASPATAWLTDASHPSICVVGPEGSGKASLMQNSLQTLPLSRTATLSCSAQTSAHTLLHTLHQHTVQVSGAGGRVLRPKDGGGQLIVLLRGLNQTSPDRYGTSQLHALLQQLLTYHGFFDDALEWIGLEGIQFVVTMALEGAGRNLSKAEKQMDKLSKGLVTVDEQVAELKARFEGYMKEATHIKINLDKEQIELGIRFGKTLIIDDIVDIPPVLHPLLRRDLSSQGPRQVVVFCDKALDFHADFRLLLCTKNERLQLTATEAAALQQVSFITTRSGLSAQLLGLAIRLERPELELKSSELTRGAEEMKMQLEALELSLLQELASSEGNLLENTALLDSLNKSKANAETISKSIAESERLRTELQQQREGYLPLAEYGSSLFFGFSSLHSVNHMYNFNVNTILHLFEATIKNCKDTSSTRLDALRRELQVSVFHHVTRSLFKADRLLFAIQFVHATQPKMFQPNEWELFSGSLVVEAREAGYSIQNIGWIEEEQRTTVARLQTSLPALFNTLRLEDTGTWAEYSRTTEAETAVPSDISAKITPFQKVLLIQATRPGRLYACLQAFCQTALALPDLNPPPFDLGNVFSDSDNGHPILLLIAGGVDPSQELEELARKTIGTEKLHSIAMGQGQQEAAVRALRKCAAEGGWLYLQNIHLMLASIPVIQKELGIEKHENFRLWMTAEPDDRFPSTLLQDSLKITFEAPPGIKNNLLRSLTSAEDRQRNAVCSQAIFVVAWLHALLQERRTYIPQAWTKFYEFSSADFRVSTAVVDTMTNNRTPEWEFVRGTLQEVIYGGRIESSFDMQVLAAYLTSLINGDRITGREGQLAAGVTLPVFDRLQDYLRFVNQSIPSIDAPALFGLPANIGFSWQLAEGNSTVQRLKIAGSTTALSDRKEWADAAQPLLSLWKKLCSGDDLHSRPLPPVTESQDPLEEVLQLELVHALKTVQSLHTALTSLSKMIRGTQLPDKSTTAMITALCRHETPDLWQDLWTGPQNPAEYLSTLLYRTKSTENLVKEAKSGELLSRPVDLSQLLRPTSLLTALRQKTARVKKVPMDELVLRSAWNAQLLQDHLSVTVKGLLLQGALFESVLKEVSTSSAPYSQAPPLTLAWTPMASSNVYSSSESVLVPIYTNAERETQIATVQMPCGRDTNKWNIASIALFLK
ncbi:unnamed protein product, partial [Mesorhabditis spiculigera]